MKTKSIISFVILITLLTIPKINSQWQQTGMTTGSVSSISGNTTKMFAGAGAVYYSTDNGTSWSDAGINNYSFLVGCSGNNVFGVPTSQSHYIYVSNDNGLTWTQHPGAADGFVSAGVNGSNLYVGNIHYGIYHSSDNGANWTGFPGIGGSIYSIAAGGDYVFAGKENSGIYLSSNGGVNWTPASLPAQRVNTIAVNGNVIYAGTPVNGIYMSNDNGATWNQSTLNNQNISAIAVSGSDVFAGATNGVYYSHNGGLNWVQRNEGFTILSIGALFINGNYIYAGTDGAGIWKRSLSELVAVQNISIEVPMECSLSQNYPNPFNPTTNFEFRIAKSGLVNIKVYDVRGKEVSALVNEELKPGTYKADFDGSKFASGVYFYRLVSGNFIDVKKMILVK